MKLVHKAVIERGKIFEDLGAGLFETLEEEHLGAGIELLKEMAQVSHRVTASRNTQHIMHETLDKLLCDIFAGEVPARKFPRGQKLVERYGLGSKCDWLLLRRGHADDTPDLVWRRILMPFQLY